MDIYSKDRKAAHVCSHYRSPIVVELVNISITISVYSFVNQGRVSRVSGWRWGGGGGITCTAHEGYTVQPRGVFPNNLSI